MNAPFVWNHLMDANVLTSFICDHRNSNNNITVCAFKSGKFEGLGIQIFLWNFCKWNQTRV